MIFWDGSPVSLDPWRAVDEISLSRSLSFVGAGFAAAEKLNTDGEGVLAKRFGFEVHRDHPDRDLYGERGAVITTWRFPNGREVSKPLGSSFAVDRERVVFFDQEVSFLCADGRDWLKQDLYRGLGVNRYLRGVAAAWTSTGCWVGLQLDRLGLAEFPVLHDEALTLLGERFMLLIVSGEVSARAPWPA